MYPASSIPQEHAGELFCRSSTPPPCRRRPSPAKRPSPTWTACRPLINEFASARIMLARGPLYLYQSIQDYRVITVPVNGRETVVACGGLHVLWEDLAEVRSVAVHPALQNKGLGRAMVLALIEDARRLLVRHVFTFTLAEPFFRTLGFSAIARETIPPVVWAECSKCPKFYKCDEVGMMLHLNA